MKINLYFFNFSVLTSIAILGCGKKNNINPQLEISTSKSYFVANKYTQFSNLYSFDYKTNTTTLLLSRPASDDAVVFEKFNNMDNFQGIYFVERFSPNKNSRVTFYSVNSKNIGIESTKFPTNLYSILFANNALIGLGYDKGEVIKTNYLLNETYTENTQIKNLDNQNISNPSVSSLLYANNRVYVVSEGSYKDQKIKPTIYQLTDDLLRAEKKWPIENCFNAARQLKVIDESKLVISCNPYTIKDVNETKMSLFLIDTATVEKDSAPLIKEIISTTRDKDKINQYDIGGISADRNSIFVSEKRGKDKEDINNSFIVKSYWIDLSNPETIVLNDANRVTNINTVSGSVTYNYVSKSYLFSCLVDRSNSTCIKGKGAVSQDKEAVSPTPIDFGVKGVDEIKFPIPVF